MMVPVLLQSGSVAFGLTFLLFALVVILISLVFTGIQIYMAYWTYKDAQKRRIDSPELWAIVSLYQYSRHRAVPPDTE